MTHPLKTHWDTRVEIPNFTTVRDLIGPYHSHPKIWLGWPDNFLPANRKRNTRSGHETKTLKWGHFLYLDAFDVCAEKLMCCSVVSSETSNGYTFSQLAGCFVLLRKLVTQKFGLVHQTISCRWMSRDTHGLGTRRRNKAIATPCWVFCLAKEGGHSKISLKQKYNEIFSQELGNPWDVHN